MVYFNTNHETGVTLAKSRRNAETQENKILSWFKSNPSKEASPEHILDAVFDNVNVPVTSIRRAMTNLSNKDMLVKTDKMVKGSYGKMIHTWKLK